MKDKTEELHDKMSKAVDISKIILEGTPILSIIVGASITGNGTDFTSCISSSEMQKLDPKEEGSKMVATLLKGLILYLRDALQNDKQATEMFTEALLEAIRQTRTIESDEMESLQNMWDDRHDMKYRFRKMRG
jgi:hypothetical protein